MGVTGGAQWRSVVERHNRDMLGRRAPTGQGGAHLLERAIENVAAHDVGPDRAGRCICAHHLATIDRNYAIGNTLQDQVSMTLLPSGPRQIALTRLFSRALSLLGLCLCLFAL